MSRRATWFSALVSLLAVAALLPSPAMAEVLEWRAEPVGVSGFLSNDLGDISCGSPSLCVASDTVDNGDSGPVSHWLLATADPGSSSPTWTASEIDADQLSCASQTLCVGAGGAGEILTSTDPGAASPTYRHIRLNAGEIEGISCAPSGFCVALTSTGVIASSQDPGASEPVWTKAMTHFTDFGAVSCASTELCIATAYEELEQPPEPALNVDDLLVSTNPAAAAPEWRVVLSTERPPANELGFSGPVACVAVSNCLLAAGFVNAYISSSVEPASDNWIAAGGVDIKNAITPVTDISCGSPELCAAGIDDGDYVYMLSNPWSGHGSGELVDLGELLDLKGELNAQLRVSCASASLCVSVDSYGRAMVGEIAHHVAVSLGGGGSGTVTGSGISCPGTCSNIYPANSVDTLTATPAAGSEFSGWSGACTGTGVCEAYVGADETVSANFSLDPAVTVSKTGNVNTGASNTGKGNVGDGSSNDPRAVIAKFRPLFETRAALRGKTLGLLVGFPKISGLAPGADVVIRCRSACAYPLRVVRRRDTHGSMTVILARALVLRAGTIVEIAVTEAGHVGRFVDYGFRRYRSNVGAYETHRGCVDTAGSDGPCT